MHHSSVPWEITLLYFFSWNWTKGAHHFLQKISPNLYFNRLLLLKVYKILAEKKYTEELCLMTLKIDAKFEEKLLIFCFKNDKNLVDFDSSTWSLQNLHFHWFLLCKVFNVWPKKYRGVVFHDTEEWCKIWRKPDLWFGKCHEEYAKFSPEHLKVSKLGLDGIF